MKEPKSRIEKSLLLVTPVLVFLALWELLSRSGLYNINLFPPPTIVARALYSMLLSGELLRDASASLSRAIIGYASGAVLGIGVGVLTGRTRLFQYALGPLIQLLRPIPPISYVPLAILWFGLGEFSKYFLVFIGVFFPIWISTHLGVSQVSKTHIWAAESLGADRRRVLVEVILPAALPFLIAGMRTSIAIAFYCLVAAEIAGAFSGIAFRVSVSHLVNRVDKMMAGLVVLGIMSAVADRLFSFLIDVLFPWYEKSARTRLRNLARLWLSRIILLLRSGKPFGPEITFPVGSEKNDSETSNKGRIIVRNLSVSYPDGEREIRAVRDVTFEANPGEFVCLLGTTGCGKSTILNVIAGFVKPTSGEVLIDDTPILKPEPERGIVFQHFALFPWKTVEENIAFGPRMKRKNREERDSIVDHYIRLVGLSKFRKSYPSELSGGMQQRVAIARVLANNPTVILMDEPFGSLDSQTRSIMQESLLDIWRTYHKTIVFVTHDVEEAVFLADTILVMTKSPGQIKARITVPLERPRRYDVISDKNFVNTKHQVLSLIREETLKTFHLQTLPF